MWSDNGKNFIGANKELKTILSELNQSNISSTLINQKIAWKFNPPSCPWQILGIYCKNYKIVFDKFYKGQTYDL